MPADILRSMGSERKTDRDVVLELVQGLPRDSSFDEILRELAFVRMVDRGLADLSFRDSELDPVHRLESQVEEVLVSAGEVF